MRKLILQLAITLDGFIEGPKGEYDWCFTDQDYGMGTFIKTIDALFMGRATWELTQRTKEAMSFMPPMETYVFSTTLGKLPDGGTLIRDEIGSRVREIKQSQGKNIWLFGGASLTKSLLDLGLVDEMHLAVHPLLLGAGKQLFEGVPERTKLTLLETKSYSSGLVMLKYGFGHTSPGRGKVSGVK